jgi:hypothetical protein
MTPGEQATPFLWFRFFVVMQSVMVAAMLGAHTAMW